MTSQLLRLAILAFPREFRVRFGPEMMAAFEERVRQLRAESGRWAHSGHVARTVVDVLTAGMAERVAGSTRIASAEGSARPNLRRGDHPVTSIWTDVRQAARMIARRPGFALVAIATLGVGIGASSAMFTLVSQVVLRPLPFPNPEKLVQFYDTYPERGITSFSSSPATFIDWREQLGDAYVGVAASTAARLTYTGTDPAESLVATQASANWFTTLGVSPQYGRAFDPAEDKPGNDRVVVVSQGFWLRYLGGDPGALGRPIPLDGDLYTVIGVMPAAFAFPGPDVDLWVPLTFDFDVAGSRGAHYLTVVGRLASGTTLNNGRARLDALMSQLREQYPEPMKGWGARVVGLQESIVGSVRPRLLLFLGAVALMLLIGVVNVANLVIVRAVEQSRELAIRAALGASRGRVVRQLVIESVSVALAAAGVGMILASLVLKAVVIFSAGTIPRLADVRLGSATILAALGLALGIGLLLGGVASIRALRPNPGSTLRSGRGAIRAGLGRDRLRSGFLILQFGTAMVLVVGAGLLLKSFRNLVNVDPGYHAKQGLVVSVELPSARYPDDIAKQRFFGALQERLVALPGIDAAAVGTQIPLEGYGISFAFWKGGTNPPMSERLSGDFHVVSPGFFATLGIAVIRGRDFSAHDQVGSPPSIIISESLARQVFPDIDPIGRGLHLGYGDPTVLWTVVGIVGDVRQRTLAADPQPGYYLPMGQVGWSSMRVVLRTKGNPTLQLEPLRTELAALDPLVAVRRARTLAEHFSTTAGSPRFTALLISGFALVALGLALAGIFSVTSYIVHQQTREIGIRIALGERPAQVRWSTSRTGLQLAVAGVALGLLGSVLLTRWLEGMLFGIERLDGPTLAMGAALFVVVALAGTYWPARQASSVDPMVALRGD